MRIAKRLGWVVLCLLLAVDAYGGEVIFFYHTDPAGTPLAMTDSSGNVVWRGDYKPFGEEIEITPEPENKLKFVGKEKDKETGLLYFGARYMEGKIGRFISPDPVGAVDPRSGSINHKNILNPQRLNYYAYGLNNPYRYIDPDGNDPDDIARFPLFERVRDFVSNPSPETVQRLFDPLGFSLPQSSSEHNDMGFNRTKDAYETSKAGGKHAGYLQQYRNRSTREVQDSLRSHEKRVEEHREKLVNPEKGAEKWGQMSDRERKGTLNKWREHLQRNQEQADIMRGILRERGIKE